MYPKFFKTGSARKIVSCKKLQDNESSSGLLDLSPDVLRGVHDKHPEAADIAEESLLHGPVDYIPPNVYDLIDKEMIYNSVSKINQGLCRVIRNGLGAL